MEKNHLQLMNLINRTRHYSKSKPKSKNALALYTISAELNKIKNISKRSKPNSSLFNNIPFPEQPKLSKVSSGVNLRTRSASHSPKKEVLHTCPSSISNYHTPIPKTSLDRTTISKFKAEIERLKSQLKEKDETIKKKDEIIKEKEKHLEISQNNLSAVKSRYSKMKDNYGNLLSDFKNMRKELEETQKEIKFLNEKELKLMQVIYLIKEKGINIDDVLNDVSQMGTSELNTLRSQDTVYFPDKVQMNDIMTTQKGKSIPKMDFGCIPSYHSDSSEEEDGGGCIIMDKGNMKFNSINFTHEGGSAQYYSAGGKGK